MDKKTKICEIFLHSQTPTWGVMHPFSIWPSLVSKFS